MKEDKIEEEPKQQEQETAPQPSLQEAIKEQAHKGDIFQAEYKLRLPVRTADFQVSRRRRKRIADHLCNSSILLTSKPYA